MSAAQRVALAHGSTLKRLSIFVRVISVIIICFLSSMENNTEKTRVIDLPD